MDCGRLIFDSSSPHHHHGQMLVLGGADPIFRGTRSVNIFGGIEECANNNGKRRPFFTSPDELLEEEYYDEQLPEKKRRLSPEQVHMLERSFEAENKLEPDRKSELAKKPGLQPRQVAVWFQNRRARWKTKQLERDYDRLKAAYDALLADHDSLLKDNDHLRSQVASLSEKVQGKDIGALVGPTTESEIVSALHDGGGGAVVGGSKGEDHLSTGSGESVVVDGPHHHQLLDSSGESYVDFHQQESCCFGDMTAIERCGVHSEEDDVGSDDGCNYGLPHGDIHNMFGGNNDAAAAAVDNWWGVWTSN